MSITGLQKVISYEIFLKLVSMTIKNLKLSRIGCILKQNIHVMYSAQLNYPVPANEPVLSYSPDSVERQLLKDEVKARKAVEKDIPMIIDGKEVFTGDKVRMSPPYEHQHTLGYFHKGNKAHVQQAINSSLAAKEKWSSMDAASRAAIFLKAADLLSGPYRAKINAATMLAQSKNAHQAEIDAACEFIDFLRFNVHFMYHIYAQQPISGPGMKNILDYRPLEGFILAITPFNFTAIAGNIPAAPALMGNVVVWKPAETQIYSAQVIMEVMMEAGLPAGVINMVFTDGPDTSEVAFAHPELAGIHFTGSTGVFKQFWKRIGENIDVYRTYPRLVGETGGKDFVVVHASAQPEVVATALVRGAFEFQGQKCSAASRAYIPESLWPDVWSIMETMLIDIKVGTPEDFGNFVNAVIDEKAYNRITRYIEQARSLEGNIIVFGGTYDKSVGYYITPTVILTKDPHSITMEEEIFGPVLTIYVYPDDAFESTLKLVDSTSPYALTGAIISQDRNAIETANRLLRNAAGNFYINDKPTGAVVGQQPFGGARASGTNDKAGSYLNLLRWVSPRNIKETFVPPVDYRYPFLG
jgi:1-pyrroline-5-carboxylate dehydrogenase